MATRSTVQLVAMGILASVMASAQTYADPQRRFTLEVPAGWAAESFGQGVKVAHGAAYLLVMDAPGEAPDALVTRLSGQFSGQWTKFQQIKRGTSAVAGQAAPFTFDSGVNPKGVPSFLKVVAVSVQGRTFALVASAPEKEFPALKAGFDQVEQSFKIAVRTNAEHRSPAPPRPQLAQAVRPAAPRVSPSVPLESQPIQAPTPQQLVQTPAPVRQTAAPAQDSGSPALAEQDSTTRLATVEHAPKALVSILGKGFLRGSRKTVGGVKSGVDAIRGR